MKCLQWALLSIFALLLVNVGATGADEPPPAVKEILKQFEIERKEIQKKADAVINAAQAKVDEQVNLSKQRVVTQLMVLQDKYCKEGKLDQALVVRDQIRLLRNQMTKALPAPDYLRAQAADVGKVFYYRVKGKLNGSIYGTDVYTSDSNLATCAVHAGVVKVGEEGIVKVTILPGQASYARTTRHGVTSNSYGNWGLSFSVDPLPVAKILDPKEKNKVHRDPGTLHAFRGMNGHSFLFEVTGAKNGKIWGSEVYTDDSTLAKAAVHAGVLTDGEKGVVKVTILAGQSRYKGSQQNDVTSDAWDGWVGSFKVEASKAAKK